MSMALECRLEFTVELGAGAGFFQHAEGLLLMQVCSQQAKTGQSQENQDGKAGMGGTQREGDAGEKREQRVGDRKMEGKEKRSGAEAEGTGEHGSLNAIGP